MNNAVSYGRISISTTSATIDANYNSWATSVTSQLAGFCLTRLVNITTATTYYLVGNVSSATGGGTFLNRLTTVRIA
jgi:hypothetical protein